MHLADNSRLALAPATPLSRLHERIAFPSARKTNLTHVRMESPRSLGRTAGENRLFVNAVLYVLKIGIQWDDLPERFGTPNAVWKRYDRWSANGVWERVGGGCVAAEPVSSVRRAVDVIGAFVRR